MTIVVAGDALAALDPTNGLEQLIVHGDRFRRRYRDHCLSANVDLSMNQVSQFSFEFLDEGFRIFNEGTFKPNVGVQLGRFEMSVASVRTGDAGAGAEKITIVARPIVVRMLKDARGNKVMKNISPTGFVLAECGRLGIPCVAQKSQKRDRVARDVQEKGIKYGERRGKEVPSSWTTFRRLADELGFVVFESAGVIYFGKPTWLVRRTQNDPVIVNWKTGRQELRTQWVPECSRTLDGELKTVNVKLPFRRWRELRPGRAFKLNGVPFFDEDTYIISTVTYDLSGRADAIDVTATIPVNPEKKAQWGGTDQYNLSVPMSLRVLCEWAGWKGRNLDIAVAVAMAESGGDAEAVGDGGIRDAKWGYSIGLFQIRSLNNPRAYSGVDAMRIASKLKDAQYNVKVAYKIWQQSGWTPWSVYTSGAYRRHMGKDFPVLNYTGKWIGPTTTHRYNLGPVKPHVAAAANEVGGKFDVSIIYGVGDRPSGDSDHPKGLALDLMCRIDQGDAIAQYILANAHRLSITYVIWKQRIWSPGRSKEGWRRMEDRGSVTANHYDHVHVSFLAKSNAPSSLGHL